MTSETIITRSILKWEGGYSDNPNDAGGETKWGISSRSYPTLDIASLTLSDAVKIAERDYWHRLRLDEVADPRIRSKVFDIAFNMGAGRAAHMLQKAVGVPNDGIVGIKTLNAVNSTPALRVINALVDLQVLRYAEIVVANGSQAVFLKGWMKRALDRHEDVG